MNILVVEDEAMVARRVIRLTKKILGDKVNQLTHIDNIDDAETFIVEKPIDLVLLDLNLTERNGFRLLKHAVACSFQTIVISAYTEQAITAFEYGVIDFVPKPFNEERLKIAFERLNHDSIQSKSAQYLGIKKATGIELIKIDTIKYIQGAGNYGELVCNNGQKHLHEKSLEGLNKILPESFFRVHKSYIVNLLKFDSLQSFPGSKYQLTLKSGDVIPVGRSKLNALKIKLNVKRKPFTQN